MKTPHYLFFFLVCPILLCQAQENFTITGSVQDYENNGIPFANVLLIKVADSTFVKGALANEEGVFKLNQISADTYYLKASLIGYTDAISTEFSLTNDLDLSPLILNEGESLDEVLVQAKKPLFTQEVDRLVINVENSIVSSGGSALEVLERSPGVVINRQSNNISIVGKDGVVVMINGKMSYVPASNLVQMLDGMSADNIESIELITTPPANLDAEGNAGFINIVLKKNLDVGLNGSYSLSAGYGNGFVSNDNFNFNYRKDKLNVFGGYSFRLDQRDQTFFTSREYLQDGDFYETETESKREPSQRNHNIRMGLDYELTEKTIFGAIFTAFDNKWTMDAINTSFDFTNDDLQSQVIIANTERNQLQHMGGNINFRHNFEKQEFISMDMDFLYYEFDNPTDYINSYFDGDNSLLFRELLRSRKETPLTTWVGKLDYGNKKGEDFKYEIGVKGTKNDFENDVSVQTLENGQWVFDPTLTNFSVLDESILAAYVASDYKLDEKNSFKFGVRYEYTDSKLDTDTEGTVVDREYGIWFPSIFYNRKWSENFNTNLSFSKRITRPTFNDLAPFVIFFDPNTFITGNAALQPAISNTFKFDLNYQSYFLSFQYTDEEDSIARFQESIDSETGRLIFETSNLDYTRTFSIVTGVPIKITNWWRTQNNLSFIHQEISSVYDDEPIILSIDSFSANSTHSFKIDESLSSELSGFYQSAGFFGRAKREGFYGINIGVQKKFSDKWGTLKFSINDLMDSIEWRTGTDLPDENFKTQNTFDFSNRTFILTYTRNFGNKDVRSSRDRKTGAEEERQRVN